MKLSRYARRFHDPYAIRQRTYAGGIIHKQWMVSFAEIIENGGVNAEIHHIDRVNAIEHTGTRYVLSNTSVESLRK